MRTVRFPYLGRVSCLEGKTYIQKLYFLCIHGVGSKSASLGTGPYILFCTKQVLGLKYIFTWGDTGENTVVPLQVVTGSKFSALMKHCLIKMAYLSIVANCGSMYAQ